MNPQFRHKLEGKKKSKETQLQNPHLVPNQHNLSCLIPIYTNQQPKALNQFALFPLSSIQLT